MMQQESIKRHIERIKREPIQELSTGTLQTLGTVGTLAVPVGTTLGAYYAAQRAKKAREQKVRQGGAGDEYDKAQADLKQARKKQVATLGLAGGEKAKAAKLARQKALNKGLHNQAKLFSKTPPQGHGEVNVS